MEGWIAILRKETLLWSTFLTISHLTQQDKVWNSLLLFSRHKMPAATVPEFFFTSLGIVRMVRRNTGNAMLLAGCTSCVPAGQSQTLLYPCSFSWTTQALWINPMYHLLLVITYTMLVQVKVRGTVPVPLLTGLDTAGKMMKSTGVAGIEWSLIWLFPWFFSPAA